ncbi:MAG: hypothetical protein IJH75_03600 [Mogibacterium sp.]|nr:hypothetical protein [Mogibacterium sp.]
MSIKKSDVLKVAGGFLLGTAGVRILTSDDAKKVYVQATAAGLRMRDEVLDTSTKIRENADDILEDAKEINLKRNAVKAEADVVFGEEVPEA